MNIIKKIIVAFCFLLSFANASDFSKQQLILSVQFPQNYDYVPSFDTKKINKIKNWHNKKLILVGSGDKILAPKEAEFAYSASDLQLQKSEALRLAHRRAKWLRDKLINLGLKKSDLQIGVLVKNDDEAIWGGLVRIYAIQ